MLNITKTATFHSFFENFTTTYTNAGCTSVLLSVGHILAMGWSLKNDGQVLTSNINIEHRLKMQRRSLKFASIGQMIFNNYGQILFVGTSSRTQMDFQHHRCNIYRTKKATCRIFSHK